jgi:hypothetical protein
VGLVSDLNKQIQDIIWKEFERQAEEVPSGPWVDRQHDIIDGTVDMEDVADAIIVSLKMCNCDRPVTHRIVCPARVEEQEFP